jgi:putative ABC transport system permease protein
MKFLPLVWKNLMRRKLRTLFTLLSILVAFVLYGYLAAINAGFSLGIDVAGADRLLTIHKVSLIQPLPESHGPKIAAVEGVTAVTISTWFGGIYQDPRNFFAQIAVDPEPFLEMYPEYVLSGDQKKAWLGDRTGAIAGRGLAERFGWKVGDRIPIQGNIWRKRDGNTWEFTLDGIYEGDKKGVDTTQFFFHHKYLEEGRQVGQGLVGWFILRVADPATAADVARRVDGLFANSPSETKTSTEKAFVQAFANQIGDIGALIRAIAGAVFFTILLVAGNTMAQAVRERTNELGVLKTLGFSDRRVLGLVMLEACLLAIVGGGLGLAISWLLVLQGDPTGSFLPAFYFPIRDVWIGIGLLLALGLAAGALPAMQAMKLRIVDALRRT